MDKWVDPWICVVVPSFRNGPRGLNWLHDQMADDRILLGHFERNSKEHYAYCLDTIPIPDRYIPNPEYKE